MLYNDFDATAKVAALAPTSRVPVSGSNKTCFADFDPTPYGPEYLRLTQGDVIQDVEPTMAAEGWAYGSRVLADGSLSDPGWYPHTYCKLLSSAALDANSDAHRDAHAPAAAAILC